MRSGMIFLYDYLSLFFKVGSRQSLVCGGVMRGASLCGGIVCTHFFWPGTHISPNFTYTCIHNIYGGKEVSKEENTGINIKTRGPKKVIYKDYLCHQKSVEKRVSEKRTRKCLKTVFNIPTFSARLHCAAIQLG